MRETFKPYFDHRYLMKPWGGNSVLFTAEYVALVAGTSEAMTTEAAETAIQCFLHTAIEELPSGESFSHDDMTAVVCLSHLYNLKYHKTLEFHKIDIIHRLHPRDIIFYMYALGGIYRVLAYPLLPLLAIMMAESVGNHTYKIINGEPVLATDGALLTWLRLNTFHLPLTKKLVEYILKLRGMRWTDYFLLYFGPYHPNTVLIREREGI